MADTENTFSVGGLYVRQVKETSFERDASGAYTKQTDLPGFLELCVDVNGATWIVDRRKAPGLLADIERAKESQQTTTPTPTPTSSQQ
jgi:hypothetical protein